MGGISGFRDHGLELALPTDTQGKGADDCGTAVYCSTQGSSFDGEYLKDHWKRTLRRNEVCTDLKRECRNGGQRHQQTWIGMPVLCRSCRVSLIRSSFDHSTSVKTHNYDKRESNSLQLHPTVQSVPLVRQLLRLIITSIISTPVHTLLDSASNGTACCTE